jgi:hypothetical protein
MSKIIRREFMGSWPIFWLLCLSILGIPLAILYYQTGLLQIEHEIEDAETFVAGFRARR